MAIITTKQAAVILGVSAKTVTRRAKAGEIESLKLQGRTGGFLFDEDVVREHASRG